MRFWAAFFCSGVLFLSLIITLSSASSALKSANMLFRIPVFVSSLSKLLAASLPVLIISLRFLNTLLKSAVVSDILKDVKADSAADHASAKLSAAVSFSSIADISGPKACFAAIKTTPILPRRNKFILRASDKPFEASDAVEFSFPKFFVASDACCICVLNCAS